MSIRTLCLRTGMARSTWSRRVKDPGTWRLEELRKVAQLLNIPLEKLADGVDS